MNFIDISSWQAGIDLPALFMEDSELDGVIVKLTQGTGYVNPEANGWLNWLIARGKLFGTYHYLDGSGAIAEARHYADAVKAYPGGVMAIDYEDAVLAQGTDYLKACLDEVTRIIGVKPLVYCSQSVTQTQDFREIAAAGYQLWVAQYADFNPVHGFLKDPWQKGSVAPFQGYLMQQYTSCGHLEGYSGNLDFDKFLGTSEDWLNLAGVFAPSAPKGPDPVVISDLLHGEYGNGPERVERLTAAGYDADLVQRKINELYGIALSCKKKIVGNEEYMNQIVWIVRQL